MDNVLLPVGTKVMCNGKEDVIIAQVDETSNEYAMGYTYVLKEEGYQNKYWVDAIEPDNVHLNDAAITSMIVELQR